MALEIRTFFQYAAKPAASLFVLLFACFLFPQESYSEFYKYVDKKGTVHYVDSKSKIPKQYRTDLTVYEEKYDNLSEEEREIKKEEERSQAEARRKEREAHLQELRRKEKIEEERLLEKQREEELAEKKRQEQIAREEYLKHFQTKVEIVGYGQALVPCTLVYKNREVEAKLLLDTGCSITTIHHDTAKKLGLKTKKKGKAETAGGTKIAVKYGKLSYIKVGPHKIEDMYVGVIKHKGRESQMEGLLGMNFLAGLDYKIDYAHSLIRWAKY